MKRLTEHREARARAGRKISGAAIMGALALEESLLLRVGAHRTL